MTSRRSVHIVHISRPSSEPRGTGRAASRISVRVPFPLASRAPSRRRMASPISVTSWPCSARRLGAHLHVLPDGAEVGRQPVGNDDDPALGRQIERALGQQVHHGRAPSLSCRFATEPIEIGHAAGDARPAIVRHDMGAPRLAHRATAGGIGQHRVEPAGDRMPATASTTRPAPLSRTISDMPTSGVVSTGTPAPHRLESGEAEILRQRRHGKHARGGKQRLLVGALDVARDDRHAARRRRAARACAASDAAWPSASSPASTSRAVGAAAGPRSADRGPSPS